MPVNYYGRASEDLSVIWFNRYQEIPQHDLLTQEFLRNRRRLAKVRKEAEDLTAKLWNLVNAVSENGGVPLLKAKREQLKAVSESIEQLSRKNVPVPDDLHGLKKSLTDEIEKVVSDQVVLYFLKEQLSQILDTIENNGSSDTVNQSPGKG
jgi:hypothetical protein